MPQSNSTHFAKGCLVENKQKNSVGREGTSLFLLSLPLFLVDQRRMKKVNISSLVIFSFLPPSLLSFLPRFLFPLFIVYHVLDIISSGRYKNDTSPSPQKASWRICIWRVIDTNQIIISMHNKKEWLSHTRKSRQL